MHNVVHPTSIIHLHHTSYVLPYHVMRTRSCRAHLRFHASTVPYGTCLYMKSKGSVTVNCLVYKCSSRLITDPGTCLPALSQSSGTSRPSKLVPFVPDDIQYGQGRNPACETLDTYFPASSDQFNRQNLVVYNSHLVVPIWSRDSKTLPSWRTGPSCAITRLFSSSDTVSDEARRMIHDPWDNYNCGEPRHCCVQWDKRTRKA
ncbi:hypothetical protein BC835DRAFT_308590 [Cytidiella melzeri]|nr:hypothetical protein BC835DRAFT_308590 [Cytidiella melzeri]